MSRAYKNSSDVPNEVLAARLRELADFITKPAKRDNERLPTEFYMRIPAEVDHDADLVMVEAARRLSTPPPSAAVTVTKEMEERALNAHDRHWTRAKEKIDAQEIVMNGERMVRLSRSAMRAALTAAIQPPTAKETT